MYMQTEPLFGMHDASSKARGYPHKPRKEKSGSGISPTSYVHAAGHSVTHPGQLVTQPSSFSSLF